ncbi:MAG: tail fiber protein [Acidimicrobiales bacterium]|nr:tail fiber protein [Acidimicrobiales bacterium]MCB9393801.1 tail fiber protein [Acidimicrobiaceae bacterium]
MPLLELGLIDGDYWSEDSINTMEAAVNASAPAGVIYPYVGSSAPTGWLLLNGATVSGAQTLYPDLWAVAPASWKSGSSLVLPNMANRFPIGAGTTSLGSTGGANTKTIAEANLPAHSHTYSGTTSTNGSHAHGGVTGDDSPDHTHHSVNGQAFVTASGPILLDAHDGGTSAIYAETSGSYATTGATARHAHGIGADGSHSHTFSGTTSSVGSGTALDITPAHLALSFIIKAH